MCNHFGFDSSSTPLLAMSSFGQYGVPNKSAMIHKPSYNCWKTFMLSEVNIIEDGKWQGSPTSHSNAAASCLDADQTYKCIQTTIIFLFHLITLPSSHNNALPASTKRTLKPNTSKNKRENGHPHRQPPTPRPLLRPQTPHLLPPLLHRRMLRLLR